MASIRDCLDTIHEHINEGKFAEAARQLRRLADQLVLPAFPEVTALQFADLEPEALARVFATLAEADIKGAITDAWMVRLVAAMEDDTAVFLQDFGRDVLRAWCRTHEGA